MDTDEGLVCLSVRLHVFCEPVLEVEQYRSALCTLHSQAVVDAQSNFIPESLELLRLN